MGLDKPQDTTENVDAGLLNQWQETLNTLEKYSDKLIEDCFFSIRVKLMIKVLNQISKENRLSKYDEKIFEYFHHLIWYYYQTISLYEQNKEAITNSKAKEIIKGICTVLSSQLNQFEENQQHEYIYYDKRGTRNPIRIEKDEIISKAKNYVLKMLGVCFNTYIKEKSNICYKLTIPEILKSDDQHSCYIKLLEELYMGILNDTFNILYKIYIDTTKTSTEKINDLQFRKAANFYYESIKQEKENLEMIIKVQVNALEDELKHMDIEVLEQQKIHEILDTLIEAYQHLGREIESLSIYFKETESMAKEIILLSRQEFWDYIIEEGAKKYIQDLSFKQFPSDIQEFIVKINSSKITFEENFRNYIKEIINYRSICENTSIQSYTHNFIVDKTNMINEFLDCFIYIKEYYDLNAEQLNLTSHSDIFKGIYETIEIKLESLTENKDIFLENINKNSTSYDISQADKYIVVENMLYYWFTKAPSKEQFIETLEQLYIDFENDEIILKYKLNFEKQKQQQKIYFDKKYVQFLREHLLFELTTYEEILNYSVCRLRQEQELDAVKLFVETMDTVSFRIEELLKKYEIYTIKPKPYDIFDGKEQEVLMAEKHEGFEKGQIIKLMNTGYKYNNAVIIRANVIAAK